MNSFEERLFVLENIVKELQKSVLSLDPKYLANMNPGFDVIEFVSPYNYMSSRYKTTYDTSSGVISDENVTGKNITVSTNIIDLDEVKQKITVNNMIMNNVETLKIFTDSNVVLEELRSVSKLIVNLMNPGELSVTGVINDALHELTTLENVTSISSGAFRNSKIHKIDLRDVVACGSRGFYGCVGLVSVDIPKLETVSDKLFYNCSNLTKVVAPTVLAIENRGFYGCVGLISVDIPLVKIIGKFAFAECKNLTTVNGDNITNIGESSFYNCSKLTKINISGVTTLQDRAFGNCSGFTRINLTSSVSICGFAFEGCTKLYEINLGERIINIGARCFQNCDDLKKIIVSSKSTLDRIRPTILREGIDAELFSDTREISPKYKDVNYESIGYELSVDGEPEVIGVTDERFEREGYDVVEVVSPGKYLSIKNRTTYDNGIVSDSLTNGPTLDISMNLSNLDGVSITPKISSLAFDKVTEVVAYVDSSIPLADMKSVKKLTLKSVPRCTLSVSTPANPALKELIVSENIVEISPGSFKKTKISKICLGDVRTLGDYSFEGSDMLVYVRGDSVLSIGNACFNDCVQLLGVSFPMTKIVMEAGFNNCSRLTSVNLPYVTEIGAEGFKGCVLLKNVSLPRVVKLGDYCFSGCKRLLEISLPELISIGVECFNGCIGLTDVDFPKAKTVADWGFYNCENLVDVNMPEVTSIGSSTFCGCKNITKFEFSEHLEEIGKYCFVDCENMEFRSKRLRAITNMSVLSDKYGMETGTIASDTL